MPTFEPVINLLVLLTVLSVAAERIAELIKTRNDALRQRASTQAAEHERVAQIQARVLAIGIILAVAVKADLFSILTHLDDPWSTLGWVRVSGAQWFQSAALQNVGTFLYALAGSALTGVALGFGSKFWHDLLDTVYELRNLVRQRASEPPPPPPAAPTAAAVVVTPPAPPPSNDEPA